MNELKVSLWRIRRTELEAELQYLASSIEREGKEKLKRLSHSPLFDVNIASQILQRVIGLDSIVFFVPMLLQSIGFSYHASFLASLIASVIQIGVSRFTYSTYIFFDCRRKLVSTCISILLAQVCLLGFFLFRGDPVYHLSRQSSDISISYISRSPYQEGWIIKVEMNNPDEVKSLIDPDQYTKFSDEEDVKH